MKEVTIVGEISPAKTILRSSLDLTFCVKDLLPKELNVGNIGTTDLVVYIAESVDEKVFERLRISHKSLILVSAEDAENTDLYIPIANFQNFLTEKILEGVRLIKDFSDRSIISNLSEDHLRVLNLLTAGGSEEDNLKDLGFGRSKYFTIKKELRIYLGANKNWQLAVQASQLA
jgi:hypothetical protein